MRKEGTNQLGKLDQFYKKWNGVLKTYINMEMPEAK